MMRYFLPAFIGILTLGIWEIWVALANIPLSSYPHQRQYSMPFWKMPIRCSAHLQ